MTKTKGYRNTDIDMVTVRSLDLANWLCQRGYRIMKVIDSEHNPQYKLFLFAESNEIEQAISDYINGYRGRK